MITYRYNLAGKFATEEYDKIASKALKVAKGASAVDTGAYRKSWRVRLSGDYLLVSNSLRYAAPVELGSVVHKKHKHKIRNALSRMGLNTGSVSLGAGTSTAISTQTTNRVVSTSTRPTRPSTPPITPAEVSAPALLLNRYRQATRRPSDSLRQPTISKSQLFNRSFLLGALATATLLREEPEETEEEDQPEGLQ